MLYGDVASPSQTFTIRPASASDLPAIVGLYNWAVNQTFATIDAEPLSAEEAHGWWDEHVSHDVLVVAEDAGFVIGWARLMPWRQRGFEIVEDLVYVDPVHQGHGVGRALLERLLEEARAHRFHSIVASIAADNAAGLQLHRRLGFEVVGTLRDAAYKFDRWMDITLVQRMLGE